MKLSDLREWLSAAKSTVHSGNDSEKNNSIDDIDSTDSNNSIIVPPFEPTKRLRENDYTILDMLHSAGHENVSFCITDPHLPDNPVIYISEGFVRLTGYEYDEVVGKNCRFLQGPETEEQDRKRIFDAVKTEKECSVNLLNYKKDGTKFVNEVSDAYNVVSIACMCNVQRWKATGFASDIILYSVACCGSSLTPILDAIKFSFSSLN